MLHILCCYAYKTTWLRHTYAVKQQMLPLVVHEIVHCCKFNAEVHRTADKFRTADERLLHYAIRSA